MYCVFYEKKALSLQPFSYSYASMKGQKTMGKRLF